MIEEPQQQEAVRVDPCDAVVKRADWVLHALIILTLIGAFGLCYLAGVKRWGDNQPLLTGGASSSSQSDWVFNYGKPLPSFRISNSRGYAVTDQALRGHWTLLVLADPACEPCITELAALRRDHAALSRYVQTVAVVKGESLFRSPTHVAQDLQRSLDLPFPVYVDPGAQISRYCDARNQEYPHSLLVDPAGVIRLDVRGWSNSQDGFGELADGLLARFADDSPANMPLTQWPALNPIDKNVPVSLEGGTATTLGKLSADRVLIVTFLTGTNPGKEWRRIEAILSYVGAPGVRFLFVCRDGGTVPPKLGSVGPNLLIVSKNTAPLFKAYDVTTGPVSGIVFNGRRTIVEAGALDSAAPFEQAMAYTILLSQSRRFVRG